MGNQPLKVVVMFEDDLDVESTGLKLSDFTFAKSRGLLKDIKVSLSDTVIAERRESPE